MLLELDSVSFQIDRTPLLVNVSLTLNHGQSILLSGDNGSGKTTLLNVISGVVRPSSGMMRLQSPNEKLLEFRFGSSVLRPKSYEIHTLAENGVGRLWQHDRVFSELTGAQNMAVANIARHRRKHQLSDSLTSKIQRITATIEGSLDRPAGELSQGQRKRLAIARLLCSGATLLLLDEPLMGLDSAGRAQVLELLREISDSCDVSMIVVEHTVTSEEVSQIVDKELRLNNGNLVECNQSVRASNTDSIQRKKDSQWITEVHSQDCKLSRTGESDGKEILRINQFSVPRSSALSFAPLSLSLAETEVLVIAARNGWGKSSLLLAIAGLTKSTGTIELMKQNISSLNASARANAGIRLSSPLFQFPKSISVGMFNRLASKQQLPQCLSHLYDRRIDSLSGGEVQLFSVCVALSSLGRLILLDEPYNSLDDGGVNLVNDMIRDASRQSTVIIAVPSINRL